MPTVTQKAYMQIGEVAERTGLTPRTLRYYEEKGLLDPPSRMEGGFRLYSEADVERLELIKKMRDLLGYSLAEIKKMVDAEEVKKHLSESHNPNADRVTRLRDLHRAIEANAFQLDLVEQKLEQLSELKDSLQERLARYRAMLASLEAEADS